MQRCKLSMCSNILYHAINIYINEIKLFYEGLLWSHKYKVYKKYQYKHAVMHNSLTIIKCLQYGQCDLLAQ